MIQEPESAKFYLYCIIPAKGRNEFGKIGIGGSEDQVYTIDCKDIAAVVSNPSEEKFESSEDNILAHQRVVQRVFEERLGVPLPFATLTSSKEEVLQLLEERYTEFRDKLIKLDALGANGSRDESNEGGAKELIEEAVSQSAASAVKIRQLNEEISQLRSMRYEKAIEAAAEVMMKKLSAHFSTALASLTEAIEGLQEKMETMQANISNMSTARDEKGFALRGVLSLDHEIQTLRERMERLNRRSIEDVIAQAVVSEDQDSRRS